MTNHQPLDPATDEISQKDFLNRLARLCETRSDEIRSLKLELTRVRTKLRETEEHASRLANGLEGTCISCKRVAARNQEMVHEISILRAERDEARREVCNLNAAEYGATPEHHADGRNWDCFKQKGQQ